MSILPEAKIHTAVPTCLYCHRQKSILLYWNSTLQRWQPFTSILRSLWFFFFLSACGWNLYPRDGEPNQRTWRKTLAASPPPPPPPPHQYHRSALSEHTGSKPAELLLDNTKYRSFKSKARPFWLAVLQSLTNCTQHHCIYLTVQLWVVPVFHVGFWGLGAGGCLQQPVMSNLLISAAQIPHKPPFL